MTPSMLLGQDGVDFAQWGGPILAPQNGTRHFHKSLLVTMFSGAVLLLLPGF